MRRKTTAERVIERKIQNDKKAQDRAKGTINYYLDGKQKNRH